MPHDGSICAQDYLLVGGAAERAKAAGLVDGMWYRCAVPRHTLKALVKRSNYPATRDTLLWLSLIIGSGLGAYLLRDSYWAIPLFVIYGALYGGSADSRWHEASHGTAFRTRWPNEALYQLASFMILRRPTVWRWSHARHHSQTLITGRDPEIAVQRPPDFVNLFLALFALKFGASVARQVVLNALGRIDAQEQSFIPASEHHKVIREARAWLVVYAMVALACAMSGTLWPAVFVGLPSFYGAWLYVFFGLPQHAALPENVLDHRLSCRTIHMNRVARFLYWNMNYHVEHHMFPMVPYHALAQLHEIIQHDCPPAYPHSWAAYRELIPALLRQRKDPSHFIARPLPRAATQ